MIVPGYIVEYRKSGVHEIDLTFVWEGKYVAKDWRWESEMSVLCVIELQAFMSGHYGGDKF